MRIDLHRSFLKEFKKLPTKVRHNFIERKNLFLNNHFHPLLNNLSVDRRFPGCRSINVTGDYRAIFKEMGDTVLFMHIDTHSELYG